MTTMLQFIFFIFKYVKRLFVKDYSYVFGKAGYNDFSNCFIRLNLLCTQTTSFLPLKKQSSLLKF